MAISSAKDFKVGLAAGSGTTKMGKVGGSGGDFNSLIGKLGKDTQENQNPAFGGMIGSKVKSKNSSNSGDKITKRS